MIHSVEIENFKNIRHQKIDLERLTVFVGPNGCGKTSVLQAIHLAVQSVATFYTFPHEFSRSTGAETPNSFRSVDLCETGIMIGEWPPLPNRRIDTITV